MSVRGSCLCGDVAWAVEGPLEFMTHCHCSRCRKAHGAAFSTAALCDTNAFRFTRGRERTTATVESGSRPALVAGACLASALMVGAGLAAAVLAEDAEGKSLEHLTGDPGAPHPAP